MIHHWILFILPIVIAFPTDDSEYTGSSEANILILDNKLTHLEKLLHLYNIPHLDSLLSCRSKHEQCPFVKEKLLNYVENVCKIHKYVPNVDEGNLKKNISSSPVETPLPSTDIGTIKSKIQNHVASTSMIYLLFWTYGSSLQSEQVQQFKEYNRIANETLINYFLTINNTLNVDARGQLAGVLHEKVTLDNQFNIIIKEIESNFTRKATQLDLVGTEIQQGNYLIAMMKFLEMSDVDMDMLSTVRARVNDCEKFLEFIKILPSREPRLIGYKLIFEHLLYECSVFTLQQDYRTMESSIITLEENSEKTVQKLPALDTTLLDLEVKSVINGLIVHQNSLWLWNIYKSQIDYSKYKAENFNPHLEEIVETFFKDEIDNYNLEKEVEAVLKFADDLAYITQSARVYIKLVKILELKNIKYFKFYLKIASKVKQLTLMENYANTPIEVKNNIKKLKEELPPVVKSIIWGQVCIKNRNSRGFLRTNDRCDSSRRNVIITPKTDIWEFESSNDGNSFQIRNYETKEYLYTTDGSLVFTGHEDDDSLLNQLWSIRRLDYENDEIFYIKNEALQQFLGSKESSDGFVTCMDAITKADETMEDLSAAITPYSYYKTKDFNQEWLFMDLEDCF